MKAPALNDTPWPEFEQIASALRAHLDHVTARILAEVFDDDASEASEVAGHGTASSVVRPSRHTGSRETYLSIIEP